MKNIIACENVFDDCLKLGENKGWDLEYHEVLGEKRYVAVKENLRVVGNNPIEMLGLLVLAENAKIKPIKQIK